MTPLSLHPADLSVASPTSSILGGSAGENSSLSWDSSYMGLNHITQCWHLLNTQQTLFPTPISNHTLLRLSSWLLSCWTVLRHCSYLNLSRRSVLPKSPPVLSSSENENGAHSLGSNIIIFTSHIFEQLTGILNIFAIPFTQHTKADQHFCPQTIFL